MNSPFDPWLDLSLDAACLTFESTKVIGLRIALAARRPSSVCVGGILMSTMATSGWQRPT